MRSITISYKYSGPEEAWRGIVDDFIAGLDGDPDVSGKFSYQVTKADDGRTRIHWGRWDSQETLKTMQSRDYFKTFSARLKELADEPPQATAAEVVTKTKGW